MTGYPPPYAAPRAARRWPMVAGVAIPVAILAAALAAAITAHITAGRTPTPATPPSPSPAAAPPMAPAAADRATCAGYDTAGRLMAAAVAAVNVLPPGVAVTDPAVQSNPQWKAAAARSADLYGQAADALRGGLTAGTTPALADTAAALAAALTALRTLDADRDAAAGDVYAAAQATDRATAALCNRLAP